MSSQGINIPTYTPIPSVGHELGVLFGFVGVMILVTAGYYLAWIEGNKRSAARESKRRAALVEKGIRPLQSSSNTSEEGETREDTHVASSSGGMFEEKHSEGGSGKVGEERVEVI